MALDKVYLHDIPVDSFIKYFNAINTESEKNTLQYSTEQCKAYGTDVNVKIYKIDNKKVYTTTATINFPKTSSLAFYRNDMTTIAEILNNEVLEIIKSGLYEFETETNDINFETKTKDTDETKNIDYVYVTDTFVYKISSLKASTESSNLYYGSLTVNNEEFKNIYKTSGTEKEKEVHRPEINDKNELVYKNSLGNTVYSATTISNIEEHGRNIRKNIYGRDLNSDIIYNFNKNTPILVKENTSYSFKYWTSIDTTYTDSNTNENDKIPASLDYDIRDVYDSASEPEVRTIGTYSSLLAPIVYGNSETSIVNLNGSNLNDYTGFAKLKKVYLNGVEMTTNQLDNIRYAINGNVKLVGKVKLSGLSIFGVAMDPQISITVPTKATNFVNEFNDVDVMINIGAFIYKITFKYNKNNFGVSKIKNISAYKYTQVTGKFISLDDTNKIESVTSLPTASIPEISSLSLSIKSSIKKWNTIRTNARQTIKDTVLKMANVNELNTPDLDIFISDRLQTIVTIKFKTLKTEDDGYILGKFTKNTNNVFTVSPLSETITLTNENDDKNNIMYYRNYNDDIIFKRTKTVSMSTDNAADSKIELKLTSTRLSEIENTANFFVYEHYGIDRGSIVGSTYSIDTKKADLKEILVYNGTHDSNYFSSSVLLSKENIDKMYEYCKAGLDIVSNDKIINNLSKRVIIPEDINDLYSMLVLEETDYSEETTIDDDVKELVDIDLPSVYSRLLNYDKYPVSKMFYDEEYKNALLEAKVKEAKNSTSRIVYNNNMNYYFVNGELRNDRSNPYVINQDNTVSYVKNYDRKKNNVDIDSIKDIFITNIISGLNTDIENNKNENLEKVIGMLRTSKISNKLNVIETVESNINASVSTKKVYEINMRKNESKNTVIDDLITDFLTIDNNKIMEVMNG